MSTKTYDLKNEVRKYVNPNKPVVEYNFSRKTFRRNADHNPVTAPNTTPAQN